MPRPIEIAAELLPKAPRGRCPKLYTLICVRAEPVSREVERWVPIPGLITLSVLVERWVYYPERISRALGSDNWIKYHERISQALDSDNWIYYLERIRQVLD